MKYEESVHRLDEILKALNNPSTPLDDAIVLFDEGQKICKTIEKTLSEIESKIAEVTKDGTEKPIS